MIKFFIITEGGDTVTTLQSVIYLVAGAAVLGLTFFLMMRSIDKKLNNMKSKSKKRR